MDDDSTERARQPLFWNDRRSLRHSYRVSGFDVSSYGDSFADVYDEWYPDVSDAGATERFVTGFGDGQRILELGTGTGRLVMPLEAAGHHVVAVDSSMAMLRRFRAASPIVAADMADLPLADGAFDTVLVATNTLFNLVSLEAQRRCLHDARRVLRLGGRVVVEADVPSDPDDERDRLVTTRSIRPDEVVLTATIRDESTQTVTGQHVQIREDGIRLRPWKIRFTGVEELDAIADSAGLRLGDRWEDWTGRAFTSDSGHHVSVYVAI